jgi:hypothetical protein
MLFLLTFIIKIQLTSYFFNLYVKLFHILYCKTEYTHLIKTNTYIIEFKLYE